MLSDEWVGSCQCDEYSCIIVVIMTHNSRSGNNDYYSMPFCGPHIVEFIIRVGQLLWQLSEVDVISLCVDYCVCFW